MRQLHLEAQPAPWLLKRLLERLEQHEASPTAPYALLHDRHLTSS